MKCSHCNGDIEIRNPHGFCDHLYYPDCCSVCTANKNDRGGKEMSKATKIWLYGAEIRSLIDYLQDVNDSDAAGLLDMLLEIEKYKARGVK